MRIECDDGGTSFFVYYYYKYPNFPWTFINYIIKSC